MLRQETNYDSGFERNIAVTCVKGGFVLTTSNGKEVFKSFSELVNKLAYEFGLVEVDETVLLDVEETSK